MPKQSPKYIFLDTETGGIDPAQHDVLQIAWCLTDSAFEPISRKSYFLEQVHPMTQKAFEMHGLTKDFLMQNASLPEQVYREFYEDLREADYLVGHYVVFDVTFVSTDCLRRLPHKEYDGFVPEELCKELRSKPVIDTKRDFIDLNTQWRFRAHPGPYLDELCRFLKVDTKEIRFHLADADVEADRLCVASLSQLYKRFPPERV